MMTRIFLNRTVGEKRAKCIWRGDLATIPRQEEWVDIDSNHASEKIISVTYCLRDQSVEIILMGEDNENTYPEVDPKF